MDPGRLNRTQGAIQVPEAGLRRHEDGIRRVFHDAPKILLVLPQRLLRPLTGGYVANQRDRMTTASGLFTVLCRLETVLKK
jgi:hypothetical protein